MPDARDPLICPRCGAPKRADQFECVDCLAAERLDDHERCIDDPPARMPQAFEDWEGAD